MLVRTTSGGLINSERRKHPPPGHLSAALNPPGSELDEPTKLVLPCRFQLLPGYCFHREIKVVHRQLPEVGQGAHMLVRRLIARQSLLDQAIDKLSPEAQGV